MLYYYSIFKYNISHILKKHIHISKFCHCLNKTTRCNIPSTTIPMKSFHPTSLKSYKKTLNSQNQADDSTETEKPVESNPPLCSSYLERPLTSRN